MPSFAYGVGPHGVVVNMMDCKQVQTSVVLLHSLSDEYPGEQYKVWLGLMACQPMLDI